MRRAGPVRQLHLALQASALMIHIHFRSPALRSPCIEPKAVLHEPSRPSPARKISTPASASGRIPVLLEQAAPAVRCPWQIRCPGFLPPPSISIRPSYRAPGTDSRLCAKFVGYKLEGGPDVIVKPADHEFIDRIGDGKTDQDLPGRLKNARYNPNRDVRPLMVPLPPASRHCGFLQSRTRADLSGCGAGNPRREKPNDC